MARITINHLSGLEACNTRLSTATKANKTTKITQIPNQYLEISFLNIIVIIKADTNTIPAVKTNGGLGNKN